MAMSAQLRPPIEAAQSSAISQLQSGELVPVWQFHGHSGATVMLYGRGRERIVRKTASEFGRNERLRRQSALQRHLSGCGLPFPCVLDEGIGDDGFAFFDMEYVPANNLAALVCGAAPYDKEIVVSTLDRVFRFFRLTTQGTLPAASFHAKIDQVADHCRLLPQKTPIAGMAARLNTLQWDAVPSSVCHGDMTLENMLVSSTRGLVFVDCDDCFVSSYWLDAAKIFQDVSGQWCLRNVAESGIPGLDRPSVLPRLQQLIPALRAMLALIDPQLAIRLPQFTALSLFRTLPYARDPELVDFVLERMTAVLDGARL
jgi:aminoglycoside phosphotransferase